MTRDEAIKKLTLWIHNDLDYYNKFPSENAKNLLKYIETELKMVPPLKKGTPYIYIPDWEDEK